jgi:nucleotide-binding universal stress UspA family protein
MDKILIPCDFSDQAISAFRLALDMAHAASAEIHLLNVVEVPIVHDELITPVQSFDELLLKELRDQAETRFEELRKEYPKEKVVIKTNVEFGPVIATIIGYQEEQNATLVVMGTKGVTGLQEVLIGSTAEKIVRYAPCPVIVVKKYSRLDELKHIVFPNSMEEGQEDLLMHVKALQHVLKATLHLVWIETSHPTDHTVVKTQLEGFAKRFMLQNYTLNVFKAKSKESGVIDFTHKINANMIAMGTHARKGLNHLLKGSVTEDVVNHVDCPIWTYVIKK